MSGVPACLAAATMAWAAPPLALLLAWWWDQRLGEPPAAWHPVAWMGRLLGPPGAAAKRVPPAAAFGMGALVWLACAAALFAAAWFAQHLLVDRLGLFAALALAPLLKPMFAWRMLRDEVLAVQRAFEEGAGPGDGLRRARVRLARLVSRDVGRLDEAGVREAAIETLAENLNDSVVAPLFWFALLGLPGAVVYRFANTADAMWGYRGEWEWAGKFAARADDALSWLPARLTAVLLVWVAPVPRAGIVRPASAPPGSVHNECPMIPSDGAGGPWVSRALPPSVRSEPLSVRAESPSVRAEPVEALAADFDPFEKQKWHGPFDKPVLSLVEGLRVNGDGIQAERVEAAATGIGVRASTGSVRTDGVGSTAMVEGGRAAALTPGAEPGLWRVLRCLRPIARLTPSPNGGWPMGAMALLLGVRLGKPGVYLLNAGAAAPSPAHLAQALAMAGRAASWALALALPAAWACGAAWACAEGAVAWG